MKRRTYIHPMSKTVILKSEGFVCLSVPIGPGPGPGGGGQAKQGSLDEFSDCDDVDAVGGGSCEASGTSALWGE